MNVSLTPELEQFVRSKVESGKYITSSEVVREALRLLEERDRRFEMRLAETRREIQKGLDSGPAVPEEDAFKLIKERIAEMKRNIR